MRVALPDRAAPSSMTAAGPEVLVGAAAPSTPRSPRLVSVSTDRTIPIRLHATSPYAEVATLVSLAADEAHRYALGAVRDGAHSNVRWSVWSGTARTLSEQPQGFNTFGGLEAGDLVGLVSTPVTPVIVGTWAGRHGLDGAVWTPLGERWVRHRSAGSPLASTAQRQVSPRAGAAQAGSVIIAGSVVDLGDGVRQRAAVWSGSVSRESTARADRWALSLLPESGSRSEARAVSCGADTCWVAGHVEDRIAVWSGSVASGSPWRRVELPEVGAAGESRAAVLRVAGRPAIAYQGAGRVQLLVETRSGWRLLDGPKGALVAGVGQQATALVAAQTRAGDAASSSLFRADLAEVLDG